MTWPAYLAFSSEELAARSRRGVEMLADCRTCPRDCGVNRLEDRWAACKTGRHAVVASAFPHFGEEDCLRGWNGSGTIFFAHCNLRCVFCQNFDISQDVRPGAAVSGQPADRIADLMLDLQNQGCHNINFVTPEHVAPQIAEAVARAVPRGLALPLVYNTSAYDSLDSIELMDGLVDIYMPDFKCWSVENSRRYLRADDYPESARAVIKAMHEQVGPLIVDTSGLARRGVLLRHLVMPGLPAETEATLTWVARELGRDTYVNLMDQYRPAGRVDAGHHAEINRRPSPAELLEARALARDLGLRLDERRAVRMAR